MLIKETPTRKGFCRIRSWGLLLGKDFETKEKMLTLYYYKSPKIFTNQGTHNLPQLWHSRVVKSSNLTFEKYLAGTTPMLSVRSSLSVVQVLFWAHEDRVTYCWFFGIISRPRLWETTTCEPNKLFPNKKLHDIYSLDGDRQQRSGRQTTRDYPRETSLDSRPYVERLTKQNHDLEEQLR